MVQMIQEGFFNTFITLFVTKAAGITREKENDLNDSGATKGQKVDPQKLKLKLFIHSNKLSTLCWIKEPLIKLHIKRFTYNGYTVQ